MKKVIILIILILFTTSGCSGSKELKGRYVSTSDSSVYYEFSNGSFTGNNSGNNGKISMDEDNYVVLDSENSFISLGYWYKNKYLCSRFEGDIESEIISCIFKDDYSTYIKIIFKNNNNIYEKYYIDENSQINYLMEEGTFIKETDKIILTNSEGWNSNIIVDDDFFYLIDYEKQ